MKNGIKRSLKTDQVGLRSIIVNVNGSAGAPVASGFCKSSILSITKNAAGDHTIILKRPFNKDNSDNPIIKVTPIGGVATSQLVSSAYDRVNVLLSADVDFMIEIIGSDHRFSY